MSVHDSIAQKRKGDAHRLMDGLASAAEELARRLRALADDTGAHPAARLRACIGEVRRGHHGMWLDVEAVAGHLAELAEVREDQLAHGSTPAPTPKPEEG